LCLTRFLDANRYPPSDQVRGHASLENALVLYAIAMQVVAVGVEPGLGALDMVAGPCDHPPEPRRMVHLDKVGHLMGGKVVQHVRRREDQPPRERQRASGC